METHILTPSRWNAKHIVLAATLVLTAVVIAAAISISLSPARIHFSIREVKLNDLGSKDHPVLYYNFTIVVDNRSWHTKVHYASLSIEISYGQTGWVPAEVDTSAMVWHWLQPRQTKDISASAGYSQYTEAVPAVQPTLAGPPATTTNTTTQTPSSPSPPMTTSVMIETPPAPPPSTTISERFKVELIALVWFKFGLTTTKPYNVRVSCYPVYFFGNSNAIVECNSPNYWHFQPVGPVIDL